MRVSSALNYKPAGSAMERNSSSLNSYKALCTIVFIETSSFLHKILQWNHYTPIHHQYTHSHEIRTKKKHLTPLSELLMIARILHFFADTPILFFAVRWDAYLNNVQRTVFYSCSVCMICGPFQRLWTPNNDTFAFFIFLWLDALKWFHPPMLSNTLTCLAAE